MTYCRSSRVDLIERIEKGIPEREFVPGCEEWLIRGKRYMLFASAGVGKSIVVLVVAVEVVAQGGRVVILDVENGADEYARRLADVLEHRDDDVAEACQERLRYYEFPALKLDWTPEEWARSIDGADLVVFDSSRLVLSSVGLSEDLNDDYAAFVNALVVPLARADSTTLILDNVGHGEGGHPRGASAKGDLNEVVFQLSAVEPFDGETRGKVVWHRKRQRFSGVPAAMEQVIGGGAFELPKPVVQGAGGRAQGVPAHLPDGAGLPAGRERTWSAGTTSRSTSRASGRRLRRRSRGCSMRATSATRTGRTDQPSLLLDHALSGGRGRPKTAVDEWFPGGSPSGSQASAVHPDPVVPPSGSSPRGRTTGTTERAHWFPSGSREPAGTTDQPPPSDPSLFGAGVEEENAPEQPSGDGYHKLTEEEYAETWRKRQAREAARIREEGIE